MKDRQNQSLAILAIATAAIGFGLFGSDWEWRTLASNDPYAPLLYTVQALGIVVPSIAYFLVLVTSGMILARDDRVSGIELIQGPMVWLMIEMMGMGLLFLGNHLIE